MIKNITILFLGLVVFQANVFAVDSRYTLVTCKPLVSSGPSEVKIDWVNFSSERLQAVVVQKKRSPVWNRPTCQNANDCLKRKVSQQRRICQDARNCADEKYSYFDVSPVFQGQRQIFFDRSTQGRRFKLTLDRSLPKKSGLAAQINIEGRSFGDFNCRVL